MSANRPSGYPGPAAAEAAQPNDLDLMLAEIGETGPEREGFDDAQLREDALRGLMAAREVAGLSIEDVAYLMGVDAEYMRKVEKGGYGFPIDTLQRYARKLGLRIKFELVQA